MPFETLDVHELIAQFEAKKKCKSKLPTWYHTALIYYPNKLNIEQTSSETTAAYKSELIQGDSIIDITGGFGVDCFYFSKHFNTVTHCEINAQLSQIVKYNYERLGAKKIETYSEDGIAYLKSNNRFFDWIYIDPSRRHESKGKVFFLKDCLPNVPEQLETLFLYTNQVMIKTSPLLDLTVGINELKQVKSIHVVAVNNEVKELLWILEKGTKDSIVIDTVNLTKEKASKFSFTLAEESIPSTYELPKRYLYEPNSALLKSGGFNSISNTLGLSKLHKHSHLYTSDSLTDFPGRRFKIDAQIAYNKKAFKTLGIDKANVTTRNFPETVQQLRKKLNIKDGGKIYLFFTTNSLNAKQILVCTKID